MIVVTFDMRVGRHGVICDEDPWTETLVYKDKEDLQNQLKALIDHGTHFGILGIWEL